MLKNKRRQLRIMHIDENKSVYYPKMDNKLQKFQINRRKTTYFKNNIDLFCKMMYF